MTHFKKWATLTGATLIALLLGESVVRLTRQVPSMKAIELASPDCVYKRSSNPLLGFELKANYRNESPDYIESYERTNAHGQRDHDRDVAKPEGVTRIILLGDSVVEGYGLPQNETISKQFEALFDDGTEVLNFGVSAYCTLAEVEVLETKGLSFDPDIVVLVFVENDFDNFNREAFPLGGTIQRPAWTESLFKRSHLFRLTCLKTDLFQFRSEAEPVEWNQEAIGDNNVAKGFARFRALADKHGFQPLVAIWPRFQDDSVVDVHFMPDGKQLIVEALAAGHALPTVRLSTHFRDVPVTTISPRLQFSQGDELHPSAEGASAAAQALHAILAKGIENPKPVGTTSVDSAELDRALATLRTAEPNYARVFNSVGNDYLKKGEFAEAIEQYKKALDEDPGNAAAHNSLGIALERSGKPRTVAIEHYRLALETEPDFAEAHYNLGSALERDKQPGAQEHFIKAVTFKPQFVEAHFGLSRSLLRDGRQRAGMMGLRQVVQLDPNHVEALNLLGGELAKREKYAEARTILGRVIQLDPRHAEALNNLGAVCVSLGDNAAAMTHFEAAMEADPNHPAAAKNLKKLQRR